MPAKPFRNRRHISPALRLRIRIRRERQFLRLPGQVLYLPVGHIAGNVEKYVSRRQDVPLIGCNFSAAEAADRTSAPENGSGQRSLFPYEGPGKIIQTFELVGLPYLRLHSLFSVSSSGNRKRYRFKGPKKDVGRLPEVLRRADDVELHKLLICHAVEVQSQLVDFSVHPPVHQVIDVPKQNVFQKW